jgi:hypothetical protein
MIEGYRENSDTTEYHHDESDITEYRDEFYCELSRRVLSRAYHDESCREVPREGLCIARHHERISVITGRLIYHVISRGTSVMTEHHKESS